MLSDNETVDLVFKAMNLLKSLDQKENNFNNMLKFIEEKRQNPEILPSMTSEEYFQKLDNIQEDINKGIALISEKREEIKSNKTLSAFFEVASVLRECV